MRVTLRFSAESEHRLVTHIPEVGDRVTHGDEIWVVDHVYPDRGQGTLVVCSQTSGEEGPLTPVQT